MSQLDQYRAAALAASIASQAAIKRETMLYDAAQDMLEALKDMVEIFKNVPEEAIVNYDEPAEPKTQWDYDAFYVLGRARAAIAKATGEQP